MKTIGEHWYLMVVSLEEKSIYHLDTFCSKADDTHKKEHMKALVFVVYFC